MNVSPLPAQTALGASAEALARREAELAAAKAETADFASTAEQAAAALAHREEDLLVAKAEAEQLREAADAAALALQKSQQELGAATTEVCRAPCRCVTVHSSETSLFSPSLRSGVPTATEPFLQLARDSLVWTSQETWAGAEKVISLATMAGSSIKAI